MVTKHLNVTTENIETAAQILQEGGLVAFPTETVYGLGANAFDAIAVGKVYAAKGRPSDNPMIVHIAEKEDLQKLTPMITPLMDLLMEHFWPGPLTMVVNKAPGIPDVTTGGLDTVGVRLPSNQTARDLIRKSTCPIAAPSANVSGRPSPTKAKHVVEDLDGRIDAILMGEDCQVGIESTVVDVSGDNVVLLRPGIITQQELQQAVRGLGKKVEMDPALFINRPRDVSKGQLLEVETEDFKPKAPGMKYKHYAPKAEMIIISGEMGKVKAEIEKLQSENELNGKKVGVIIFAETELQRAAHDFFAKLRELDGQGVDLILAGALDDSDGIGFAVMNRMMKSAGYNVIKL
ncbi:L-threonylcarbamoyladenylate synthase [Clostridium aminobutyricum]|uniref:Threonylcarbamoyl-AMP synthase n=1 Tax=Clostridium aminobutyricum TaxID=33953 RepID=A0A939DA88_CLOAM|nr:L-threonylcarbamoyladenylate synthase [Clostridium aminobutyricum]MBN7774021.1 threonylcarbamoyl-AMP synthase [Clostridium aminobutyricum]